MEGRFLLLASALAVSVSLPVRAQTPNHAHYKKPVGYDNPAPSGAIAPRLQNLGAHTFPVTTKSQRAQLFFNQGINLSYGFNHAEAGRAFGEAARLDPDCAMAYWGQALVLGPNINAPMPPEDEPKAYELVQKALELKPKASERERAYIDALARRYSGKPEDRKARDLAYADAMREVRKHYPDDLEAATLSAEALMDLRPWDYWTREGLAYPGTDEIVSVLESVMKRNPQHPGALHFYIHAIEPTKSPQRAEDAADTLISLMPGAGHIVHMPAHIFMRVGRYNDAADSNDLAIRADEDYITQCRAQGIYPLGYYPHNIHFLWWAASMEGRNQVSLAAARKTASKIPPEQLRELPFLQGFIVAPYYAMVKFGRWDEILSEPKPAQESPFVQGVWHYARGMAFTAKQQFAEAAKELAILEETVRGEVLRKMPASFSANTALTILRIAPGAGRLALPRTALAGCRAAAGWPARGSRDRLLGGSASLPGEWLVAVRSDAGVARPGEKRRGSPGREALPESLGPGRRETHGVTLRAASGFSRMGFCRAEARCCMRIRAFRPSGFPPCGEFRIALC